MTENEAIEELNIVFLGDTDRQREAKNLAINALKEIQQYRTIGTVEECRETVDKQVPKAPGHKYIKYGKHKWRRKENGEIDDWAWDFEFCNGVACERCGESVCVHCNPNYDELEDCEVDLYNCPSCNDKVYRIQKYCDCGQKLDWSDKG